MKCACQNEDLAYSGDKMDATEKLSSILFRKELLKIFYREIIDLQGYVKKTDEQLSKRQRQLKSSGIKDKVNYPRLKPEACGKLLASD